jgi:predicted enzyme related to lactoylglutathione lyase
MLYIRKDSRERGFQSRLCLSLVLVLFFNIILSSCAKKQVLVPPITPEPTTEKHVGKFVWYDLITHDLQATSRFYEDLFGWSFVNTSPDDNSVKTILRQGVPIGNAAQVKPENKDINESRWIGYMSVEDVYMAAALIELNKGTIYTKPKDLPNRGHIAIALDPQGAVFALVEAENGDPPDLQTPQKNNWIGSELWTTDLKGSVLFYNLLARYELELVDIGADQQYHLLNRDGKPRAGIAKILWDDVKPNWIPYVAVEDVMAVLQKTEKYGSQVLIHPGTEYQENPVAIIADPSGAVFGIQQMRD